MAFFLNDCSQISSGLQRNTFDKPQEDCAMQKEGKQASPSRLVLLGVTDHHVKLLFYSRNSSCYKTLPQTVKHISLYANKKIDQEKL